MTLRGISAWYWGAVPVGSTSRPPQHGQAGGNAASYASSTRGGTSRRALVPYPSPGFRPGGLGSALGGPLLNGAACRLPPRRSCSTSASSAASRASSSAIRRSRAAQPGQVLVLVGSASMPAPSTPQNAAGAAEALNSYYYFLTNHMTVLPPFASGCPSPAQAIATRSPRGLKAPYVALSPAGMVHTFIAVATSHNAVATQSTR